MYYSLSYMFLVPYFRMRLVAGIIGLPGGEDVPGRIINRAGH